MIQRYFSGRMDAQEMDRFEEMLRVDEKLRAHYETDRAIRHALMNDKASIPANHASLEAHVMKTLSTVGANLAGNGTSVGISTAGATMSASIVIKTVISIVAGLGILSGVVWYAATRESTPDSAISPAPQHQQAAPSTRDALPTVNPQPAPQAAPATSPTSSPATGVATPASRSAEREATVERDRAGDEVFHKRASQLTPAGTVITPDSMQVKLKLDLNRQKKED
jgi:hypothetical protein